MSIRQQTWIRYLLIAGLAFILVLPWVINDTILSLLIFTMINIMLAQAINLLSGFAGIISIGQAGFYAIGAYTSALLMLKAGLPFWLAVPVSIVCTGIVGFLVSIPAGRVRSLYLAMLTLAFGLVIYNFLKQWSFVGGTNGLTSIPSPQTNTLSLFSIPVSKSGYYVIVFLSLIFVTWVINNLVKSYLGRSMMMMQQNEIAASSLGISIARARHFTFAVSAAITGLAGALYAHYITYLGPDSFHDMESIHILVYMVLGGWGNLIGPFLGAGFLTILPHQLHLFQEHQLLVYGIILFLSFLVFPRGIAGLLRLRTKFIKSKNQLPQTGEAANSAYRYLMKERPNDVERKINQSALLEARQVTKTFGGVTALKEVDLTLKPAEIHGLIGPNGSGKTTLVNLITGIYDLTEGEIRFAGRNISRTKSFERTAFGIARTFQSPQLSPYLTVLESVMIGGHVTFKSNPGAVMLSLPKASQEERQLVGQAALLLKELGLDNIKDELTGNLPYGNQRMVEIARALMCRPELLILDEPAAGLSEAEMDELGQLLLQLKKSGLTVLIIEHHMDFLLNLVDTVTVLDGGRTIYNGDVKGMRMSSDVQEAYLGGATY